jgi:hypothetical protein
VGAAEEKAVKWRLAKTLACLLLAGESLARAQAIYTCMSSADAFLATGSSNNPDGADLTGWNYGAAGTLVVAPAACVKGEFQSVVKFSLSNAPSFFDSTCGTNNWTISGISLELTSNYGTAGVQPNNPIFGVISGGSFVVEWLAKDDWSEGSGTPNLPTMDGVTYNSLPDLLSGGHEILCTNTYTPPGNSVHLIYPLPLKANLVADAANGGDVSLLFYAADNQINYLFNSLTYGRGNEPLIHVTATPQLRIVSGSLTGGVFHLTGIGSANTSYRVQANSDLTTTNWVTLGTVTADGAGVIQYDDTAAANHNRRFYRLSP